MSRNTNNNNSSNNPNYPSSSSSLEPLGNLSQPDNNSDALPRPLPDQSQPSPHPLNHHHHHHQQQQQQQQQRHNHHHHQPNQQLPPPPQPINRTINQPSSLPNRSSPSPSTSTTTSQSQSPTSSSPPSSSSSSNSYSATSQSSQPNQLQLHINPSNHKSSSMINKNNLSLQSDGDDEHEHEDEEDDEDGYSSSLAPSSSIPRTSLAVEDHDERYGFGSSAESESSVGLLDFQAERNRLIQKKRKKTITPNNNNNNNGCDINDFNQTIINSTKSNSSNSNTINTNSNSNSTLSSSPDLLLQSLPNTDNRLAFSSAHPQPQQHQQNQEAQPLSSVLHPSSGLYWTQTGLESSSSLSSSSSTTSTSSALSFGIIAPLHHHHHHHHHIHPLPGTTTTTTDSSVISDSSNINCSSGNSTQTIRNPPQQRDYLAPTPTPSGPPSRSSSSDRRLNRLIHEPLEINPHQAIPINLNESHDHAHQFYNSHHLRTSAHSRKNPYQYVSPISTAAHNPLLHHHHHHHPAVNSHNQHLNPATGPNSSSHRSKRSWFSSRRQKRKNSIHALSATSSSSSASLHSPPFLSDRSMRKIDGSPSLKYSSSSSASSTSSQPRRSSNGRFRRLSRMFPFVLVSKLVSHRWLKKSFCPSQPLGILLGLIGFIAFAISLTNFLIHFLDTDKEPLPWRTYCQEQPEFPHALADSLDPVNVFVGVFSIDSGYERRHLIRSTYARHSRPIDPRTGLVDHNVQLKFILGRPRIQHARRVALEMETYNDIVILDIAENMNRGKTFAYFNWASQNATVPVYYHKLQEPVPKTGVNGIGGVKAPDPDDSQNLKLGVGFKRADFVVKADDDAFIVLSELERHLRVAPKTKTYWGYLIRNLFMGGECYALSADLVDYVATSERVLDHLTGAEDKKVAKWMRIHPNATQINWVTERCWIYDHPKAGTTYAHGFLFPDEVERVRAEGRRGLTEAEIEERGEGRAQSYSTVVRWKERYIAPRNMMTMEEEVEALVEGGGRFQSSNFKRPTNPVEDLVPIEKAMFSTGDKRLKKSGSAGSREDTQSLDSRSEEMGQYNPPVRDHYEEPSLKFGRPPSELMAHMPELEDLPESNLKEALMSAEKLKMAEKDGKARRVGSVRLAEMPSAPNGGTSVATPDDSVSGKMVFSPTLRYDPEDIKLRNQRYLNRPHGGTVVVHYLKRNEWFLETSLILLGKTKTWDDGLTPAAFGPNLREPNERVSGEGELVALSKEIGKSDKLHQPHGTKRVEVGGKVDWGKVNEVEEVRAGAGVFGGARMYGSPAITRAGRINEGRPVTAAQRRLVEEDLRTKQNAEAGNGQISRSVDKAIEESVEEEPEEEAVDDIRKSQFGGAGWIRGKPRLRLGDPEDGPRFESIDGKVQKPKGDDENRPETIINSEKDEIHSETNDGEKKLNNEGGEDESERPIEEGRSDKVEQILLKPIINGIGNIQNLGNETVKGLSS